MAVLENDSNKTVKVKILHEFVKVIRGVASKVAVLQKDDQTSNEKTQ